MKSKKYIKRVILIFGVLFVLLIVYIVKIAGFDRYETASSTYNPRLSITDETVKRGSILDRNGVVLAESTWNGSSYTRAYPMGRYTAHVTGYTGVGKTGLEAYAGFQLTNIKDEIVQRFKNAISETEIVADSIQLTIDSDLNRKAYELMNGEKGSVVMMDPSTGEVFVMVSSPSFDPSTAAENWESLRDDEDSPLLNRAVSGYYPPGSTFKVITALAAMRNLGGYRDFVVDCTGAADFDEKIIHCYNNTAHGTMNLENALKYSCNTYFAALGKEVGGKALSDTAESLMMNTDIEFTLGKFKSTENLDFFSKESAVVETSIGQGETLVNPLYMAMLASSIANDGVMMKPYIISNKIYYDGNTGGYTLPSRLKTVMSVDEAKELKNMMTAVVESGTGTDAAVWGYTVSGKTGTAENPNGTDHSWFIGFMTDSEGNSPYAIAVVIENPEGSTRGAWVAGELLRYAVNNQ